MGCRVPSTDLIKDASVKDIAPELRDNYSLFGYYALPGK